jgi:hypothetical protein
MRIDTNIGIEWKIINEVIERKRVGIFVHVALK